MLSFRSRSVFRPLASALRRGFAAEAAAATSDTLKLNFFVPSEAIVNGRNVSQVTIPGSEGVFGILPNHVPTVSEMKPGIVSYELDGQEKKYFVSGGFTFVHADSVADVSAAEAIPVEDIDLDVVKAKLAEAEAALAKIPDGSEYDASRAETEIAMDVYKEILASIPPS